MTSEPSCNARSPLPWNHPDADPVADILALAQEVGAAQGRIRSAERPFHLTVTETFYDRCVTEGIFDPDRLLVEHHVMVHRGTGG